MLVFNTQINLMKQPIAIIIFIALFVNVFGQAVETTQEKPVSTEKGIFDLGKSVDSI